MARRLDAVLDDILAQPLHAACGLRLVSAADGQAVIEYQVNDMSGNVQGMLHGGIMALMHDVGVFMAVTSLLPPDRHAVTADTSLSILRPANRGETMVVRARVDRLGKSLAFMRCETSARNADGQERLIATGSLTKAVVAAKG